MDCMTPDLKALNQIKASLGEAASELVKDGMLVGLGTGSTSFYFIKSLITRCQNGLKITAVATSNQSFEQAKKGGIPVLSMDTITQIDLTIDGADEVDPSKCLIKGGGGALLREKIIADSSSSMIVIADEGKLVKKLGKFPLPVEVTPFGYLATQKKISQLGFQSTLRAQANKSPFVTDNNNFILDLHLPNLIEDPNSLHKQLLLIPGVVETGIFYNIAKKILVGYYDNTIKLIE